MMGRFICSLIAVAMVVQVAPGAMSDVGTAFDTSAVERLVDVLDTVMTLHADHQAVEARLDSLADGARTELLWTMRERSARDPELNRRIDALFETTAYKLYYLQFRNMTPDKHREIIYALPYEAIPGPAGISNNLKELCDHRGVVRRWVQQVIATIDPDTCRRVAEEWLPEGNHRLPNTYFIYDGNGDAFVRWGSVVFDLFSLVIMQRPSALRFDGLGESGKEGIERILSHEYHHVFASPILYQPGRSPSSWQAQRKDMIARRIVSEGVAMRCDGRREMQRAVMEDSATVVSWINELESTFASLDDGSLDEEAFDRWYRDSYHSAATRRLREYLARVYGDADLDTRLARNNASRPSLVYTLGWWMIGRIADASDGKDSVIGLLSDPGRVFDLYNATLSTGEDAMRIDVTRPR